MNCLCSEFSYVRVNAACFIQFDEVAPLAMHVFIYARYLSRLNMVAIQFIHIVLLFLSHHRQLATAKLAGRMHQTNRQDMDDILQQFCCAFCHAGIPQHQADGSLGSLF